METEGHSILIEIAGQRPIYSVNFIEDGKQVMSGGMEGTFRRWRVDDGREVGQPIRAEGGKIFAAEVSADHRWLVYGLRRSEEWKDGKAQVRVYDMRTRRKVFDIHSHKDSVFSISISPDSTKFVTGSADKTVFIWSLTTGDQLFGPLRHDGVVVAVRFSPSGDRIATATAKNGPDPKSIRIYNSSNGQQLLDIPFALNTHISSPLAWSADGCQLFAVSYGEVSHFETSSGSLVGQWSVPGGGSSASIAVSHNQKFVAVVAFKSLSFWDAITREQIGTVIEHASPVWSTTFSPNDDCTATGEENGKITLHFLHTVLPGSYFMVHVSHQRVDLLTSDRSYFTHFLLPLISVNNAVFKSWAQSDLTRAEELLTQETVYPFHRPRALALRALLRTRLKMWNLAIDDAIESMKAQKSVVGYIAIAMVHGYNGKHELAVPVLDLVFSVDIPSENRFLLLIKAAVLFECGKHDEAISRIDALIDIVDNQSLYLTVRAYMFLMLGDNSLNRGDAEQALKLFRRAGETIPSQDDPHLVVMSLIFGWVFDRFALTIQSRLRECIRSFEDSGDAAMQSKSPEEADIQYSTALSLNPLHPAGLLIKRSEVRVMLRLWEDALKDADEAIKVDPLGAKGYERSHAALHGMHRYDEAINAFMRMLSLVEGSSDQSVCHLSKEYISPLLFETAIEEAVRKVLCPLVLIDVESGHLCNEPQRLSRFKSGTHFKQLASSMTKVLDTERIQQVVGEYFRYVTFSHVWTGEEPSFQVVVSAKSIWHLDSESSPLNMKLKKFCEAVRNDGYRWAWSDTCCIDKTVSTVLNQSLTMMYKWYEASAATFVHLRDVESTSAPGGLTDSVWMTRAWTAQELLAPKVIRFYDRNWKPYLGDTNANHKESPEIMQEIANAIGVSCETITTFHPDDLSTRAKLCMASTRKVTIKEDIAYSLIGIFKSDIKPHYGEGGVALGHLLEEIVARSGDVTVLDWAGKSSSYNSCLPETLSVYSQPPHASPAITDAEMDLRIAALRDSLPQEEVMRLYDQVIRLPPARFASRRLHLPSIVFSVKRLRAQSSGNAEENSYRARVPGIGHVNFQTSDQLSLAEPRRLIFVHPWISDLRDPLDSSTWGKAADDHESDSETEARSTSTSLQGPAEVTDVYTRALRLSVRLHRPFHALLLQQQPDGEFKRIAVRRKIIPDLDCQVSVLKDIRIEVIGIL